MYYQLLTELARGYKVIMRDPWLGVWLKMKAINTMLSKTGLTDIHWASTKIYYIIEYKRLHWDDY